MNEMISELQEHDCVKIVKLLKENRYFDGKRPPQIGDVGTIVHKQEDFCIVEMVDSDGCTVWLADFLVGELMSDELSNLISELQKIAENTQTTFGNLSAQQINWKPSETGWSVGQCLDHLIKSNEAFNPVFEKLKTGERKNSFWENYSPLTGFFGNFLLKSLNNDAKKFKASSPAIVPLSKITPYIVGQFIKHQTEVIETIKSLGNIDLQKTVVTSPFLKLMTYRLDRAFEIAVAHEKRHFRQAERVTKAENFPQK